MLNNDILRMVRNLLDADAAEIAEIARLSGSEADVSEVEPMLLRHGQPGWQECSDTFLAHFLDGLIVYQRGRDESRPARPIETPVTNNMVLKKLRVAFELHDEDMHRVFEQTDVTLTKPELNALFRKPDNKHFRPCSDELLEAFIEGLAMINWDDEEDADPAAGD